MSAEIETAVVVGALDCGIEKARPAVGPAVKSSELAEQILD